MPGRRNYATERAAWARDAAQRQSALYLMLRDALPDKDIALVGWPTIVAHLHRFGVRRLNGLPIQPRIVRHWIARHGFPALRGNYHPKRCLPPVTTAHAVTAWLLTGFHHGALYTVGTSLEGSPRRSSTASMDSAA